MQSETPPRERSKLLPDIPNLEPVAKGVALLTAGALATAFVFNCAYFEVLDPTLLGALVLSDHIQTAVWCLPPILLLSSVVLGLGFAGVYVQRASDMVDAKAEAGSKWAQYVNWMLIVAWAVAVVAVVVALIADFEQGLGILAGGIAGTVTHWLAKHRTRVLLALPLVYVLITIGVAVGMGFDLRSQLKAGQLARPDVVEFVDRSQLSGKVIRIIDKGAILATANPVAFVFLPKDQIARVVLSGARRRD